MRLTIRRKYEMEVAHRLTAGVPENHRCRRLHGHRYVLTLDVSGEIADDGMVIEYGHIDAIVMPLVKHLDHHDANTLRERCTTRDAEAVSQNPTVELMVAWFVARLGLINSGRAGTLLRLERVELQEDSRSSAFWQWQVA